MSNVNLHTCSKAASGWKKDGICIQCETEARTSEFFKQFLKLKKDKERLDWLEKNSTLHKEIEILYLVDCYEVSTINIRNGVAESYRNDSIRTAIDSAMKKP